IYIYNKSKNYGNFLTFISVLIGFYFAFFIIDSRSNLTLEWVNYIHPLNNLWLYISGIAIFYNFKDINLDKQAPALILIPLLVFLYYPVSGNQINIVTDFNRIVFVACSVILTLGFYKLSIRFPVFISSPLANLG